MERYLSPEDVCKIVPGMTTGLLKQMRFRGDGPSFVKPSPRKVVYAEASIQAWLEMQTRTRSQIGA